MPSARPAVAESIAGGAIDFDRFACGVIEHEDQVARVLEQRPKALLRPSERLLGPYRSSMSSEALRRP